MSELAEQIKDLKAQIAHRENVARVRAAGMTTEDFEAHQAETDALRKELAAATRKAKKLMGKRPGRA